MKLAGRQCKCTEMQTKTVHKTVQVQECVEDKGGLFGTGIGADMGNRSGGGLLGHCHKNKCADPCADPCANACASTSCTRSVPEDEDGLQDRARLRDGVLPGDRVQEGRGVRAGDQDDLHVRVPPGREDRRAATSA